MFSQAKRLAIVTRLDKKTRNLLACTPIKKVALIQPRTFGAHALINYCKTGISLEYGFGKSGRNYNDAVSDVSVIFKNLGIIEGKGRLNKNKNLYTVFNTYTIKNKFIPHKKLAEFKEIKKGEVIGVHSKKREFSHSNFYPIFLHKGMYPKTLALMARYKKVTM